MPFGWFLVLLMSAGAAGGVMTGLFANSMRTADTLPLEEFDYFDTAQPASVRADAAPSEDATPAGPTLASAESTPVSTTLPVKDTSLFSPVLSYSSRSVGYTVASVTPAPVPTSAEAASSRLARLRAGSLGGVRVSLLGEELRNPEADPTAGPSA
jgi:hypothetical protein